MIYHSEPEFLAAIGSHCTHLTSSHLNAVWFTWKLINDKSYRWVDLTAILPQSLCFCKRSTGFWACQANWSAIVLQSLLCWDPVNGFRLAQLERLNDSFQRVQNNNLSNLFKFGSRLRKEFKSLLNSFRVWTLNSAECPTRHSGPESIVRWRLMSKKFNKLQFTN